MVDVCLFLYLFSGLSHTQPSGKLSIHYLLATIIDWLLQRHMHARSGKRLSRQQEHLLSSYRHRDQELQLTLVGQYPRHLTASLPNSLSASRKSMSVPMDYSRRSRIRMRSRPSSEHTSRMESFITRHWLKFSSAWTHMKHSKSLSENRLPLSAHLRIKLPT